MAIHGLPEAATDRAVMLLAGHSKGTWFSRWRWPRKEA